MQREQYVKAGPGRLYWDYRDKVIFQNINNELRVILDAGCGEGITLEKLCNMYPDKDIIGIDKSRDNIEICKRHNLPATEGDILHLNIRDESVDCCILSEVVEHLEHYDIALKEMHRVLKKSGSLILVFPNDFVFKLARLVAFMFKEAFYDPGHLRQWTPGGMKRYLKHLGFEIVRIKNIPFLFWPISLHCVIVARK